MDGKVLITLDLRNQINQIKGDMSIAEFGRKYDLNRTKVSDVIKGDKKYKTYLSTETLEEILGVVLKPEIVSGNYFRELVELWKFFFTNSSNTSLCKELKGDMRYFNGRVAEIPYKFQEDMLEKFSNEGLNIEDVDDCLISLRSSHVPYSWMIPLLREIKQKLKIGPTILLGRSQNLYINKKINKVSRKRYEDAKSLCEKIKENISNQEVENIRAKYYGRESMIYYDTKSFKLEILKRTGKHSAEYLGRDYMKYEKGKYKKISLSKSRIIDKDYGLLMEEYSNFISCLNQIIDKKVCSYTLKEGYVKLEELHEVLSIDKKKLDLFIKSNKKYFNRIIERKDFIWRMSIENIGELEKKL